MPVVTLVGYRGSGKSAVAARLAGILGCSWTDADVVLEREAGRSIADLIRDDGEQAFRDAEADLLVRLLERESGVLATGGGVVLRPENRARLRAGGRPVVWLAAPPDVLRDRIAGDPATASRRPALQGGDVLAEVGAAVAAREPLYRAAADAVVDVSIDPPERVADRIAHWLSARPTEAGSRTPPEPIP